MKRLLAAALTTLLVVVMTLAAVFVLVGASLGVAQMENPLLRAVGVAAELTLGVLLLVGTVYIATRVAVLIFGREPTNPRR